MRASHPQIQMPSRWSRDKLMKYISTFTRIMATKLGRVLTSWKRFRTQTPKLSSTSGYKIKTKMSNSET